MYLDIEHINRVLYERLSSVVTPIFISNHPRSMADQLSEFAIIRVARLIYDKHAYKTTTAFIDVFVRLKDSGVENTPRVCELSNKVVSLFPFSDEYFSIITPEMTFGDLEGEFSRIMIKTELIIKQ